MKHIIWRDTFFWSDNEINEAEEYERECLVAENYDLADIDYEARRRLETENDEQFDIEREYTLDEEVDGEIVCFADLGLWDGRHFGIHRTGSNNLGVIMTACSYGYCQFYVEGDKVLGTESHHDGTNYYEYRAVREGRDIERLEERIRRGEQISRRTLNYYTRSLAKDIKKIYGW